MENRGKIEVFEKVKENQGNSGKINKTFSTVWKNICFPRLNDGIFHGYDKHLGKVGKS